ncbi:MAG: hypothetical protein AAF446_10845 [Pseudomonadota bacterium]
MCSLTVMGVALMCLGDDKQLIVLVWAAIEDDEDQHPETGSESD